MKKSWLAWLAAAIVPLCASNALSQASASPERAFVNQYCIACHNGKAKTGGLALDARELDVVGANPEVWETVVRKLRARAMPPPGRPRPDESNYRAVLSHLETALDSAAALNPNPGRTDTFRRLNRTEYQNAIRDLLALDVDVTSLLPSDDSSLGFDNVTVGGLPPMLLERYLSAAQKISRLAIGTPILSPGGDTILLQPDLTQEDHFDGLPFGTRGGTVVRYNFPVDGQYEVRVRLTRDRNEHIEGLTEPHQLELTLDGTRLRLFTVNPPVRRAQGEGAADLDDSAIDAGLNIRVAAKAGSHALGAAFLKRPSAQLETERQPGLAHFNMDRHPRTQPAVYSVAIVGPFDASGAGDTAARRRIFVCRPARPSEEAACAKKIIASLARRAYRRPVIDADLQGALAFYKDARAEGGFEDGIEAALHAVLVSPEFLFRIERDPRGVASNTSYRVSDLELASRLSFFLWSSIPDDELLDLANRGKLREPAVLDAQVRRMLADNRSQALVTNFADQWLYLRNLATVAPDARLFPDFDDNLRQSFRRETELYFESIMREDRSALDLLRSNYTFLNERLAKHYGIPNVYGSHFRRITLDDDVRGGLLSQGSILSVTSYANRTSPVLRGKWILSNVLGTPPPPPPPNVPPLKDNGTGGSLTMRERMAQHRDNPACSGCHQLMDPIGLALENYDAIGRWRTREGSALIDVSGTLTDGVPFEGLAGLKQALLKRPELFITTMTEKLVTYGLGRGVEHYDAPAIRKIVNEAAASDYRFSSIILGIVKSTPFLMRRSE